MKLTIYTLGHSPPHIIPATGKRDWMDATGESYAYRCLPLNIANQYGWQILSPCSFTAVWDGGMNKDAIMFLGDGTPSEMPVSHFGSGIITFHVNALLRTEKGYNIFVMGPTNGVKDGISPLNGIVETDWSPYSFTMNWKITRPNFPISFAKGEPFCQIFPTPRDLIESVQPEFQPISTNPDLQERHLAWQESRKQFLVDLKDPESIAKQQKWQKLYYRGIDTDGETEFQGHQTKLNLKSVLGKPTS